MREKIVAGNWKMNLNLQEGYELIEAIQKESVSLELNSDRKLILIPPYIHLARAAELISESKVELGAQNVHSEASGAFTGEVSAAMLKSAKVQYCLVGHSERREYQKEADAQLLAKTRQLLNHDIRPIFCLGEKLEQRENNQEEKVVTQQLSVLFGLQSEEFEKLIIAYEPVWAIGTGKNASAEQAQQMHAFIRSSVASQFGEEIAKKTSILYGGSVKPENASELFQMEDVDGGLIGGASLMADSFVDIFKAI